MAAVLPLAAVLVGCGRVTIDPNDYLEVKFDGMDSVAKAAYSVDYEKMVTDNLKAFGIKSKKDDHDIERAVKKLKKYLGGELDETRNLSNGDKITFKWDDDDINKLEKKYKIKLKVSDKTIEVTDLEVPKEFDPFEYMTVEYSGIGENATMRISTNNDIPVKGLSFYADNTYGVKNGDKVTVTFGPSYYDESEIMDVCFEYGYKPTKLKKEITVEGIPTYVAKISEIEKASYDRMDKTALDRFKEQADEWDDKTLVDVELAGVDLYSDIDSYYTNNALCYIYKVTAKNPEAGKEEEKKDEEKKEEATEAENTTAAEETATKADEKKEEAAATTDEKKKDEAAETTKADDKQTTTEPKKEDKKNKDTFVYYYFTIFENVVTPDNSDSPNVRTVYPNYSSFFGLSGDAFKKGDVIFEGYETLDKLRAAIKEDYPDAKFETNIKK